MSTTVVEQIDALKKLFEHLEKRLELRTDGLGERVDRLEEHVHELHLKHAERLIDLEHP